MRPEDIAFPTLVAGGLREAMYVLAHQYAPPKPIVHWENNHCAVSVVLWRGRIGDFYDIGRWYRLVCLLIDHILAQLKCAFN